MNAKQKELANSWSKVELDPVFEVPRRIMVGVRRLYQPLPGFLEVGLTEPMQVVLKRIGNICP